VRFLYNNNNPLLTEISGFRAHEGVPREKEDTIIPGEARAHGEKPVRILNNFAFFSQGRGVLAELDDVAHDDYNLAIEGVGEVLAVRSDEMPDEDEDVDEPILLYLTPVINASIDYEKYNECVVPPCCLIGSLMSQLALFTSRRITPGTDWVYLPLNISRFMSDSTLSTEWPRLLFRACYSTFLRHQPIYLPALPT
jgi:hypothetical protein